MRFFNTFFLVTSSAIASLLLVVLTNAGSESPRSPLIGLYEKTKSDLQNRRLDIDVLFLDWQDPTASKQLNYFLTRARQRQRIPLLTLEPHPQYEAGRDRDTLYQDVMAGRHDDVISSLAATLRTTRDPVLVRFAHEMDIKGQYPWSFEDHKRYISMYRYVHQKFSQSRLAHVYWVWSPAGRNDSYLFWPGGAFVDVIGISAYATRSWRADRSLESFAQILERTRGLHRRYGRPLLIAEAGVSGSAADQQQWISEAVKALPRFPEVCGLVYFHAPQPSWMPLATGHEDWSLQQGPMDWLMQRLPLPARRGLSCVEA
jgi:beta-mannanase